MAFYVGKFDQILAPSGKGLQSLAVTSGTNSWPGTTRAAWAAGVITVAKAAAPVNTVATRKALFIE